MAPSGIPLWVSEVLPGSVHDITAARSLLLAVVQPYLKRLPILADGGYDGAGPGVYTPVKQPADGYELDWTPGRTTSCCEGYGAWANAASHCWSGAGKPCGTSP